MKIFRFLGAALVGAILAVSPACATVYLTESFTFTASDSSYSVAGAFTYDPANGQLKSIAGNVVSSSGKEGIAGLVTGDSPFFPSSTSTNGFFFDNIFDASSKQFTDVGVLFAFGVSNYGVLYYYPTPFFSTWLPDGPTSPADCSTGDLYCPGVAGTLNFAAVSPIPELSTWAMLLLGFFGIGIFGRTIRQFSASPPIPRFSAAPPLRIC